MSNETRQKSVKRDYKSRVFTMIFSQMRLLLYLADLYSAMIRDRNIYGSKKIMIPPPHFIMFYNGTEEREERKILRLSDLYEIKEEEVDLELKVVMLNINRGNNRKLMEACKTLSDYAEYIYRIREYAKESPIEEAVERAVTECIREGILKDFLEKNRAEAIAMSIYEYNESEHMRMEREDAYADGQKAGEETGRIQMLELFRRMTEGGMSETDITKSLEKAAKDPEVLEELLVRYQLL